MGIRSSLKYLLLLTFCTFQSYAKCNWGDEFVHNCHESTLDVDFTLSHRSCDCNLCNAKPFIACIGNPTKPGLTVWNDQPKNCGEAKCVECKIFGESCTDDKQCCSSYRYYDERPFSPYVYTTFCEKTKKTCSRCVPTNEVCGTTKPSLDCCDTNPNIACKRTSENEFRCTANICGYNARKRTGFSCPSVKDVILFCKCGKDNKGYKQCRDNTCQNCALKGQSCKVKDDCCQIKQKALQRDNMIDCVEGKCVSCMPLNSRGCKKNQDCCPDPDEDAAEVTCDARQDKMGKYTICF